MADMMKAMGGASGKRGMMGKLGQMMGMGGGMPQPTPEQIEAMQKQLGGAGRRAALRAARHSRRAAARRLQSAAAISRPRRWRPKLPGSRRRFNPFGGKKK